MMTYAHSVGYILKLMHIFSLNVLLVGYVCHKLRIGQVLFSSLLIVWISEDVVYPNYNSE